MSRSLRDLEKTVWRELDKTERAFYRELKRNYREALESIRKEIATVYEKYAINGELTRAQMTKYNRLAGLEKRINKILGNTASKNTSTFKRLKERQYSGSFFRHQWAIEQSVGAGLSWSTINEKAIAAAVDNDLLKIATDRLRTNGRQRIRREITQGLIRGDSYDKMARGVKDAINRGATDAMRIARTEGQKAAVVGQKDSYRDARDKAGLEMRERWDATLDMRTRPEHAALDGQYAERVGDDYMFNTSVGMVYGPLDPSAPASFVVNCRCRVSGEVVGYPPKIRRTREGGLEPYHTYGEWAKKRGIDKNKYGQKLV